jgi:tRNA1Val (adenine37-N6)-methyltransferase
MLRKFCEKRTVPMSSLTHDSISLRGAGIVTIIQQKKGHRFTLDSLLLADFCCIKPRDKILEPGAGTGVISILLAKKFPGTAITAVESQPITVKLANRNIADNGLDSRITLVEQDIKGLKKILAQESFDVIVTNPPYTKAGSGKRSPSAARQVARHDASADIGAWLDLQCFLKNKGRYNLIFPAARTTEIVSLMRTRHFEPKRARFVHTYQDRPASLVLIEAVKAAGTSLEILPPLFVHEHGGAYSDDMKKMYSTPAET